MKKRTRMVICSVLVLMFIVGMTSQALAYHTSFINGFDTSSVTKTSSGYIRDNNNYAIVYFAGTDVPCYYQSSAWIGTNRIGNHKKCIQATHLNSRKLALAEAGMYASITNMRLARISGLTGL